jgi:hypothetical protein
MPMEHVNVTPTGLEMIVQLTPTHMLRPTHATLYVVAVQAQLNSTVSSVLNTQAKICTENVDVAHTGTVPTALLILLTTEDAMLSVPTVLAQLHMTVLAV